MMTGTILDKVVRVLKREYESHNAPIVELVKASTGSIFKVLVATILSARTKDQTTASAAGRLFERISDPCDFDRLSRTEVEKLIFPVGFYRMKAKHLKELPAALDELFDGRIPDSIDDLCRLPGVGRKTANLVRAVGFGKPAICVDVHVHRISNRLGLLKTRTPFETEMRLRKILPGKHWITWNSYLVSFGQTVCLPVRPKCMKCPIREFCKRIGVKKLAVEN